MVDAKATGGGSGPADGIMRTRASALLLVLAAGLAAVSPAAAADDALAVAVALAPPPSSEALARIPDDGRRLLALRSYLRAGSGLAARWSWSAEEIRAFEGSDAHKTLLSAIAAVNDHFAAANPGHALYVHAAVRSLDTQIEHWNTNDSVGAAAAELMAAWSAQFGNGAAAPSADAVKRFLTGFAGTARPSIAAPGLSLHGRAQAVDFQVSANGVIVAPAATAKIDSVWRAEGWDQKLKASIEAAGPMFHGPLTSPDEPWHYDYRANIVR